MKTTTVSQFRANMKEHLQEIEDDQDILILSGPKNKDFVVLTLDQYNAMAETNHLLATPANTARLMESIAQDQRGEYAHAKMSKDFESSVLTKYQKAKAVPPPPNANQNRVIATKAARKKK